MTSIRILIADDHDVVRLGIQARLETEAGVSVCGEAASFPDAVEAARTLLPDVVLLDISMPGEGSFVDAVRGILSASPGSRVLMLTMHHEQHYVDAARRAGAAGYLLKGGVVQILPEALRRAREGEFVTHLKPSTQRPTAPSAPAPARSPAATQLTSDVLSPRELQVVHGLAIGRSYKELAKNLGISVNSVSTYRNRVCAKLGMRSRAELYSWLHGQQLLEP